MPSYLAGAARLSLVHADLQRTLTANPLRSVGTEVRANLQKVEDEFVHHATRLQEVPIHSAEEDLALRLLGEDEDMPFYLMKAGESLYPRQPLVQQSIESDSPLDSTQAATRSQATSNGATSLVPTHGPNSPSLARRAISLEVTLKPEAFLFQPSSTVQQGKRPARQDIKVDIFFNGSRCACAYFSSRALTASEPNRKFDETFHGQRNGMSTEQPWIMVPASQNAKGGLREHRRSKGGAADQRWEAINNLLLTEACAFDKDAQGKPTVLGEYFQSLSRIPLPEETKVLNAPKQFGVIDIVITTGIGRKDDSSNKYLVEPRGARLGRVDWNAPILKIETPSINKNGPSPTPNASTQPSSSAAPPGSTLAQPKSTTPLPNTNTATKLSNRPKRKLPFPSDPPLSSSPKPSGGTPTPTPTPYDHDSPSAAKRARLKSSSSLLQPSSSLVPNVTKINRLTTIRLPASQLKLFQTSSSKLKPPPPPPSPSASLKPLSTRPAPYLRGKGKGKGKGKKKREDATATATPQAAPHTHTPTVAEDVVSGAAASAKGMAVGGTEINGAAAAQSGSGSGAASTTVAAAAAAAATLEAKINEDCVIAFDPQGVRQVRKERGLWFRESGVLLGVRYIVVPS